MMEMEEYQQFCEYTNCFREDTSVFFNELDQVYNENSPRSFIVLAWGVILYYLYKLIDKKGISNFKTDIVDFWDLTNEDDHSVINHCKTHIFSNGNLSKMLDNLKDKRNRAAHINQIEHNKRDIVSFLNDAEKIIILLKEELEKEEEFNKYFYDNLTPDKYELFISRTSKDGINDLINHMFNQIESISINSFSKTIHDDLIQKYEKQHSLMKIIIQKNNFDENLKIADLLIKKMFANKTSNNKFIYLNILNQISVNVIKKLINELPILREAFRSSFETEEDPYSLYLLINNVTRYIELFEKKDLVYICELIDKNPRDKIVINEIINLTNHDSYLLKFFKNNNLVKSK